MFISILFIISLCFWSKILFGHSWTLYVKRNIWPWLIWIAQTFVSSYFSVANSKQWSKLDIKAELRYANLWCGMQKLSSLKRCDENENVGLLKWGQWPKCLWNHGIFILTACGCFLVSQCNDMMAEPLCWINIHPFWSSLHFVVLESGTEMDLTGILCHESTQNRSEYFIYKIINECKKLWCIIINSFAEKPFWKDTVY